MPEGGNSMISDDAKQTASASKRPPGEINPGESSEVDEVEGEIQEKTHDKEEGEDEDDEDEEYEIEAIIDAKKGTFGSGRYGYLVKWKGYGPEHNSWVDESDAQNAEELIAEYWKKTKEKAMSKKKSKITSKETRKYLAREETSESESAVSKKRTKSHKSGRIPSEDEDDDTMTRGVKKFRKNDGRSASTKSVTYGEEDDKEVAVGSMKGYTSIPTWEHLIGTVDTVERDEESNELFVYFTLAKTGEHMRENARVCGERFPQKLLRFYESNLRWKQSDGTEASDS